MTVYVVLKADCAGVKILAVFFNKNSAKKRAMDCNMNCDYDARYYVESFEVE